MFKFVKFNFSRFYKRNINEMALLECEIDKNGLLHQTAPDKLEAINAAATWLCRAQDNSTSSDGGVARDYSLLKGWSSSYPETTGYIIPTFIDLANRTGNEDFHRRAKMMLDWCVEIQFPEGGFQGGLIDSVPKVPVTFNTGQILLGLSAGAREYATSPYISAMHNAAAWLRDSLGEDGCWHNYPTPFAAPGEKAYETHVAWGLFEAERISPGNGYGDAGLRQVEWALAKQLPNGWFASNCLTNPNAPLTHTIGYVLRGVIEAYLLTRRQDLLEAACRTADALIAIVEADGRLPGRLNANWQGTVDYVCLTGSLQVAHCLFLLFRETGGNQKYFEQGKKLTSFVRRTIRLDGSEGQLGGIKGSYPVDGEYGTWQYLNWAAKFFVDVNLLEMDILGERYA